MNQITLPSGSTISSETWAAMKVDGTWDGWIDGRMYTAADLEFMAADGIAAV